MAGPRFVKLDVDYFGNPKVLRAGKDGMVLHLASMAHCGRYLTDGWLAAEAVEDMTRSLRLRPAAIERVVRAGLWVPAEGGFELHDFTAMNGTRAEVEARIKLRREGGRERQRRYRERHGDDD